MDLRQELPQANGELSFIYNDFGKICSIQLGETQYKLLFYKSDELESNDGEKRVYFDMYTVDGDPHLDVALINIEKGGTPSQQIQSKRIWCDIPIEGKAKYVLQFPDGSVQTGEYNSNRVSQNTYPFAIFSQGCTVTWLVEPGDTFKFLEFCTPRFIDSIEEEAIPLGSEDALEVSEI